MEAACPPPRPPSRPIVRPPPNACDAHCHVFGSASRFPYAAERSYTPPDAPLQKYLQLLDTLGFDRGALVQGSAHGRDNSAMLDALGREPQRLRGIAVADAETPAAELRRWQGLGVRGLRFNHFFRHGQLHYRGGVPLDAARALAPVMRELGWHLQLWIDVQDLPDTIPILKAIGLPVVIDHMGRTDAQRGTAAPGFQSLLRLLGAGGCWVKLSGAHRVSRAAPDYPDAQAFHEALVAANPDRWTPDDAIRRRILVDNPARLYDFAT
jgi:predicted TIM-barrel fold metal-dependent hydrolase